MTPMITKQMSMELALLGFLKEGPLHGYQIHQLLKEPQGLFQIWRLKQSQLYAYLGKLEDAGYIKSSIEVQTARPNRRVYQLTTLGEELYLNWLVEPVGMPRQIRQEFMVKLFFIQRDYPQMLPKLVDNQLKICKEWLRYQENLLEDTKNDFFTRSVLDYRLGQIQAAKNWLIRLKPEKPE